MIDNFKHIPFTFVDGEFYFAQIILRGKDLGIKLNGNNHARCLKTYSIYTQEDLDRLKPEIIAICDLFKARAYVHPARRNKKQIALEMLSYIADCIKTNTLAGLSASFPTVCGRNHGTERIRVVDIDSSQEDVAIRECIESLRPYKRVIKMLRTKNGYHLITHPFDMQNFSKRYPTIDVHKNNPTILYIPSWEDYVYKDPDDFENEFHWTENNINCCCGKRLSGCKQFIVKQ